MDLRPIIDQIASQADDFLDGVENRTEARAGVAEQVNLGHPGLSPGDRRQVIEGVMAILEDEGFFTPRRGRPSAGEAEDTNGD
jgi:hypothetical protein